ncbi:hypothetical protein DL98DRAFT_584019 [Cadophora sp. DSE1049]|nr:hypothetical protein DL98DRAFT_584019 [Cadophora sp. DSE1049]
MATKSALVDEAEAIHQDLKNNHNPNSNTNSNSNSNFNFGTALPVSPTSPEQAPPPYNFISSLPPSLSIQPINLKMSDNRSWSDAVDSVGGDAAAWGLSCGRLLGRNPRTVTAWFAVVIVLLIATAFFLKWTFYDSSN